MLFFLVFRRCYRSQLQVRKNLPRSGWLCGRRCGRYNRWSRISLCLKCLGLFGDQMLPTLDTPETLTLRHCFP
jgi:hypothetical protein